MKAGQVRVVFEAPKYFGGDLSEALDYVIEVCTASEFKHGVVCSCVCELHPKRIACMHMHVFSACAMRQRNDFCTPGVQTDAEHDPCPCWETFGDRHSRWTESGAFRASYKNGPACELAR